MMLLSWTSQKSRKANRRTQGLYQSIQILLEAKIIDIYLKMMGSKRLHFFLLWVWMLLPISAKSAVLPVDYVISEWLKEIRNIQTLEITQDRILLDGNGKERKRIQETIHIDRKGRYHRKEHQEDKIVHWIFSSERSVKIENGKIHQVSPGGVLEPWNVMYLHVTKKGLLQALGSLFNIVDLNGSWSLYRQEATYQIRDPKTAAIHLKKDTWFPVSVRTPKEEVYFPIDSPSAFSIPYPNMIHRFEGTSKKEMVEIKSVRTNLKLAPLTFLPNTYLADRAGALPPS